MMERRDFLKGIAALGALGLNVGREKEILIEGIDENYEDVLIRADALSPWPLNAEFSWESTSTLGCTISRPRINKLR
jgi:hypothetical protein